MGIKQLYNDNLRKLPSEYGDVSSCWEGHSKLLKNMGWNTLISVSSSAVLKGWVGNAVTDICRFHRTMVSIVLS